MAYSSSANTVDPLAAGGQAAAQGAAMGAQFGPWGAVIGGAAGFIGGGLIAQEITNPQAQADYRREHKTATAMGNNPTPKIRGNALSTQEQLNQVNTQAAPGTQPEETNPATGEDVAASAGVNVNNKTLTPGASSGGTLSTSVDPNVAQFWGEPV